MTRTHSQLLYRYLPHHVKYSTSLHVCLTYCIRTCKSTSMFLSSSSFFGSKTVFFLLLLLWTKLLNSYHVCLHPSASLPYVHFTSVCVHFMCVFLCCLKFCPCLCISVWECEQWPVCVYTLPWLDIVLFLPSWTESLCVCVWLHKSSSVRDPFVKILMCECVCVCICWRFAAWMRVRRRVNLALLTACDGGGGNRGQNSWRGCHWSGWQRFLKSWEGCEKNNRTYFIWCWPNVLILVNS